MVRTPRKPFNLITPPSVGQPIALSWTIFSKYEQYAELTLFRNILVVAPPLRVQEIRVIT